MSAAPKIAALVAAAALALTGCASSDTTTQDSPGKGSTTQGSSTPGSTANSSSPADGVPTVPADGQHLHGIGLNPADGKLYLGTHNGTWRIDGDRIDKVGTDTFDLMGFAVIGPDHFLSSGHPGPTDKLPNPVGLIESRDGGKSWTALSLTGRSDFHTLTGNGTTTIGFDGALKSTHDGKSWTPAAGDVAPASLALSADSRTVLATTQHGPVRSTDGGASFTHLDKAPLLVFLSWPAPGIIWGVGTDGAVHRSTDTGTTWVRTGTVGAPPEAFTAAADGKVAVAVANGIVQSTDGGKTFTTLARKNPNGH